MTADIVRAGRFRAVRAARREAAATLEWARSVEADADVLTKAHGAQPSHIANMQRFANEIGVGLPVTGRLDDHTARFTRTFQHAFQHGIYERSPLVVDGVPGPKTSAAVEASRTAGGAVSRNFRFAEFLTGGDRTVTDKNPVLLLDRGLVASFQKLRDMIGRPVLVLSGYRSPAWNDWVGGVTMSTHLRGLAADFHVIGVDGEKVTSGPTMPTEAMMVEAGFDGIGTHRLSGRGSHGDRRGWAARWTYGGA